MGKKILSVLVSSIVLLYGVGCSRHNEKIGLNVNFEPSIPIVDDVTGNQNTNSNSDLPAEPAVDGDLSDQSSDTKPEPPKPTPDVVKERSSDTDSAPSKPIIEAVNKSKSNDGNVEPSESTSSVANTTDQVSSSTPNPEPTKPVVDKKEEVKENKAEEVVEKDKPTEVDAKSKSDKDKPEEEKKPDPAPANPPNNNRMPLAAKLAIGAEFVAGLIATVYMIFG
jgi:hypothetical protein